MFEDYKVPIAFLILVLIIILGVKAQAQNIILFDDDDYTGFWTPANLPIDTTTTSVFFYGDKITTKVSKDSGGTRPIPYMRVWSDSIDEIVTNNTFDNDATGWVPSATPTTFEWVANGGGFTGAIHSIGDSNNDGAKFTEDEFDGLVGAFNLSFDINIITMAATGIRVRIFDDSEFILNDTITGTGSSHYENTINVNYSGIVTISLNIMQIGTGASEFYIDNVYLTPASNDSVYGYTHTITRPSDTTTYYYSQSVKWVQKDKDTIWIAAEADTVTVYPYVAPEFEEGAYTSDGNELYTIDGNRIYAKQEGE